MPLIEISTFGQLIVFILIQRHTNDNDCFTKDFVQIKTLFTTKYTRSTNCIYLHTNNNDCFTEDLFQIKTLFTTIVLQKICFKSKLCFHWTTCLGSFFYCFSTQSSPWLRSAWSWSSLKIARLLLGGLRLTDLSLTLFSLNTQYFPPRNVLGANHGGPFYCCPRGLGWFGLLRS